MERFSKTYLRRDCLGRFNINDRRELEFLERVDLVVDLLDLGSVEDRRVVLMARFVEQLTGRKPGIKELRSIRGSRGYSSKVRVQLRVTLRGDSFYNFLNYLSLVALPQQRLRYGEVELIRHREGRGEVIFKDFNIFYNLKGDLGLEGRVRAIFYLPTREEYMGLWLEYFGLGKIE